MDSWEMFNKRSLPENKGFYCSVRTEDITSADYKHTKRVCKDSIIKNLGEYYGLYMHSDTLLRVDVFEIFRNKYIDIYVLDPAYLLPAIGLAWQACVKKTYKSYQGGIRSRTNVI